ncbi:hypothetical protein D3Z52_24220, partial [Clostridiaceae bacterium]|nr:hypothetical protein [Clostridiaceae bacterium]
LYIPYNLLYHSCSAFPSFFLESNITDQAWGMAANYDLCLNSSKLGIDRCVELILASVDMGTDHV